MTTERLNEIEDRITRAVSAAVAEVDVMIQSQSDDLVFAQGEVKRLAAEVTLLRRFVQRVADEADDACDRPAGDLHGDAWRLVTVNGKVRKG